MIKNRAARLAAVVIVAGGLTVAPLLDNGEATDTTLASPKPAEAPQFRMLWRRDEIVLAGHTVSAQHERDLSSVAASHFPNARVSTRFKPLGVVPDYWTDVSVRTLYLLAATRSAEATISTAGISLRGVVDNELGWQNRLAAYKSTLPADLDIAADTMTIRAGTGVSDLCERASSTFAPGRIEFEESGSNLRSSAYPRLDRVIALATTCQQLRILITGHTDTSGTAALNLDLSLRRAEVVAEYFVNGGIDRARLIVRGAGSTEPIADDSTRHGRSRNRRIEIALELP
ncbi:MAG: OmpA family protein [Gammaproteobacteria bacterium]|nr:OmpA family protein [Gammaproteobacteria bacterium]